ncbi:uncharacterized protein LOC111882890 [Lactuca sativa]|uniref:uncharacterized protein LOC111882890 n=1 Tax=Lactuca sativa TaxID=4236 RepID=UPI000CD7EC58|nr:uncharacterized protein LOC111882890 [Lactuca sativa]
MTGDNNSSTKPTHKAYNITNIKTYVPLILDLSTRNYDLWSDLFKAYCIAYGVADHIDDTHDPANTPPTDQEWKELNNLVKLWLFGSISQKLITSAYSLNATARRIWLNLRSLFYDDKESVSMQLEDELRNITLGDLTIHDYCEKVKKITDTLEGLGEKVKDRSVVLHALNGLPSKFESVASILRFSKPLPSFSEMRSILLVEESRLNSHRVTLPSHDNHPSSPSLLHVADPSSSSTCGGGGISYWGNNSRRSGGRNNQRRQQQFPGQTPSGHAISKAVHKKMYEIKFIVSKNIYKLTTNNQ